MRDLLNKIFLLLYCLLTVTFWKPDALFVLGFLSAVAAASSSGFFSSAKYTRAVTVVYGILGCFFPSFLPFFPLVFYDLFAGPDWWPYLLPGAAAVIRSVSSPDGSAELSGALSSLPLTLAAHLAVGLLLAFLLQKWASRIDRLDRAYRSLRDDSTEQTLLLKDANRALLEKQDYEIYTATLQERNRIAREIHDNVGHMLSRGILLTGALKAINHEDALKTPLDNLETTLDQAMTSIRQSVHDLHDESVNLRESLQKLLDEFTFCHAALQYDMGCDLPREMKYSFIAIVKEALVNVSRHSNATEVHISLREHPGFWQLDIQDNGTTSGEIKSSGIGLSNIRERILALGGQVDISCRSLRSDAPMDLHFGSSTGFRIFATIPKTH